MNFEIPNSCLAIEELAQLPQWVCFDLNKYPINCRTGENAAVDKPDSWATYEDVAGEAVHLNNCSDIKGIGFVFTTGDPYCGIDLDAAVEKARGPLKPWAQEIVDKLDSYTEYSPSGLGVHIIIKGKKKWDGCKIQVKEPLTVNGSKKSVIEVYDQGRYFTVTGDHLDGTKETIEDRQAELDWLMDTFWPEKGVRTKSQIDIDEIELLCELPAEKFHALMENEGKFKKSWNHQRKDLNDTSCSGYDLSLATLAAYAGWTDQEIASLIVQHRVKYDDPQGKSRRKDYILRQVQMARTSARKKLKDVDAVEQASLEHAKAGAPDEKLEEISNRLGVPIEGVMQVGTDPQNFYFIIRGKRALIGEMDHLLTQKRVRSQIAKATSKVMKPIKPIVWLALIELCLSIKQIEELPGGTRREETIGWVHHYMGRFGLRCNYLDEELDGEKVGTTLFDALSMSHPVNTGGKWWLNINDLAKEINIMRTIMTSTSKLVLRLKEAGFEHREFSARCPKTKKKIKRNYWGCPEEWVAD